MKYLPVLLLCAYIFDESYSCRRHILKCKEYERDTLLENFIGKPDIDYINKLDGEIKILETECLDFKSISMKCWNSSYICTSIRYSLGCPCWTYEMEYENVTAARLKFNKFYPNGVNLTTYVDTFAVQNNILEVCDFISPPWPFNYITDENTELIEFSHCIENWKINCFCSSVQRSNHPKDILQMSRKSDKTARGPYKHHLELCRDEFKYNCSNEDKIGECSCWNYNITYEENALKNNSLFGYSDPNSYLLRNISTINVVFCTLPYLNCSDENLVQGCPCWDTDIWEYNDHFITYGGFKILRFGANTKTEYEQNLDLYYQKVCGQDDLRDVFPGVIMEHTHISTFTHCNNNGLIRCYCDSSLAAPVFKTNCAPELVEVNGKCVARTIDS